jgi:hypothetical protein
MDEPTPSPEEQRRAWTTGRVMASLAALAIVFVFLVLVFRGCQDSSVDPAMLDPAEPLPGTEEIEEREDFPDERRR